MAKRIPRFVTQAIVRLYTFAIMAVVVWAGYMAVTYLYRTVFVPAQPPASILEWQAVTEAERLRQPRAAGLSAPAVRAPLGHYHGVDRWFHPDLRNGCITSGCHDPIPHGESRQLRAFANLHSTFMACDVCHREHSSTPMSAQWVNLNTGKAQPPPAVLQLMGRMSTATQPADLTAQNAAIISLLRQALDVLGQDALLSHIALQLETSEAGSPVWRRAVEQLRSELPNHARGEYGAKITPVGDAVTGPAAKEMADLTERYFSRSSDQSERGNILRRLHEGVIPAPEGCLPCHRAEPPMLDFKALGYPPSRIEALTSTPVAGMMEQIRQGQPFTLPLGP